MKNIEKNRFLVWLMWAIPVACTGWFSLWIWTAIQLFLCGKEKEERKELNKPIQQRSDVIAMNQESNLSQKDKDILNSNKKLIKVGEGVFLYESK